MKIKVLARWLKPEAEREKKSLVDEGISNYTAEDYEADYLYWDTDDISTINMSEDNNIFITLNSGVSYILYYNDRLFTMLTTDYKEIK